VLFRSEALILEKEGKLCVRFFRRKDGTVLTDDCPVGLKAIRNLYRRTAACIGACVSLLLSLPVWSKDVNDTNKTTILGQTTAKPGSTETKSTKPISPRLLQGDVAAPAKKTQEKQEVRGEAVAIPNREQATQGFAAPDSVRGKSPSNDPSKGQPMMGAPAPIPQNNKHPNSPQSEPTMGKVQAQPSNSPNPPKKPEGVNKPDKSKSDTTK
jgi:hypothetical protein